MSQIIHNVFWHLVKDVNKNDDIMKITSSVKKSATKPNENDSIKYFSIMKKKMKIDLLKQLHLIFPWRVVYSLKNYKYIPFYRRLTICASNTISISGSYENLPCYATNTVPNKERKPRYKYMQLQFFFLLFVFLKII